MLQPLVRELGELVSAIHCSFVSGSHEDYTDIDSGFEGYELQKGSCK